MQLNIQDLKTKIIFTEKSVDDLEVLTAALAELESETLSRDEKYHVLANAKFALAGLRGYIRGAKGL